MLKVKPSGKNSIRCQTYAKNRRPYRTQTSISIRGNPVTYSRHNGKCNISAFHEEINTFKDWIFVRSSSRFLASEWTTNRRKFIVLSIDFDRFMTSESRDTLILPFTSKTGQSVAQNRQKNFLFGLY